MLSSKVEAPLERMEKMKTLFLLFLICFDASAAVLSSADGRLTTTRQRQTANSHRCFSSQKSLYSRTVFPEFYIGHSGVTDRLSIDFDGIVPFNSGSCESHYYTSKKHFCFGLAPRISYSICKNVNGYVNVGTAFSAYSSAGNNLKIFPNKRKLFLGFGVEQNFGMAFVRGAFYKVFKNLFSKNKNVNLKFDSCSFKIGGGYKF